MKTALVFVGILLLAAASAQQNDEPRPNAVIHGIAVGRYGQPAKRIGLTAEPLGVGLGAKLPHTRTNDAGEFSFERLLGGEDIRSTPTTKMRDTPALARVPLGGAIPSG